MFYPLHLGSQLNLSPTVVIKMKILNRVTKHFLYVEIMTWQKKGNQGALGKGQHNITKIAKLDYL
jgi:hypothetical protein